MVCSSGSLPFLSLQLRKRLFLWTGLPLGFVGAQFIPPLFLLLYCPPCFPTQRLSCPFFLRPPTSQRHQVALLQGVDHPNVWNPLSLSSESPPRGCGAWTQFPFVLSFCLDRVFFSGANILLHTKIFPVFWLLIHVHSPFDKYIPPSPRILDFFTRFLSLPGVFRETLGLGERFLFVY